jgi:hypothetical protein
MAKMPIYTPANSLSCLARRQQPSSRLSQRAWLLLLLMALSPKSTLGQTKGEIEIALVDSLTGQRLPARVQLRGPHNNLIKPKSIDSVQGWCLVDGSLRFRGKPGDYRYQIFHGPEYAAAEGQFTLDKNSELIDDIKLPRRADLAQESWLGGDLLSFVPLQRSQKWLVAEGLLLAASARAAEIAVDESTQTPSLGHYSSHYDKRGLSVHHWQPAMDGLENSPSSRLLVLAKQDGTSIGRQSTEEQLPVHVEIHKLWAAELPIWLASGRIDSVQLLSEHLTIDGSKSAAVAPSVVPPGNFRGGRGAGQMVEQIYWQMLEAGLKIPPTAGSGFGVRSSPLGYNRVYALIGSPTEKNWWEAVRAGNSFVTNGPLLRVNINGMPPGHLFQSDSAVELEIGVELTAADPVEYLEVVHNGESLYRAALDEHAKQGGKFPALSIKQSGWLVLRVVTAREFSYRLATTAPFYFEIGGKPRISRQAVVYFQQWLAKARGDMERLTAADRQAQEPYLRSAEKFWQARLEQSQGP